MFNFINIDLNLNVSVKNVSIQNVREVQVYCTTNVMKLYFVQNNYFTK